MNRYRGHTVLVHMSRYLSGPFPGAPTGRVCSQDTPTAQQYRGGKRKGGQEQDFEFKRTVFCHCHKTEPNCNIPQYSTFLLLMTVADVVVAI